MDVRDTVGRIQRAIVAILGGIGGALLAVWITHHIRLHGTSSQRDLFLLASIAVGFLVCGAAVGIAHEVLLRRETIPRAVARRRRAEVATCASRSLPELHRKS